MIYPQSYIDYLVEFHATRDYFECHEILEEYWKADSEKTYEHYWVALIQLAVGQYHERRGNVSGALKMYNSSLDKLQSFKEKELGIDLPKLILQLITHIERCGSLEHVFSDINLIFTDERLAELCYQEAATRGLVWGESSKLENNELIHRHTLRDRSEVISERERALNSKRSK